MGAICDDFQCDGVGTCGQLTSQGNLIVLNLEKEAPGSGQQEEEEAESCFEGTGHGHPAA